MGDLVRTGPPENPGALENSLGTLQDACWGSACTQGLNAET